MFQVSKNHPLDGWRVIHYVWPKKGYSSTALCRLMGRLMSRGMEKLASFALGSSGNGSSELALGAGGADGAAVAALKPFCCRASSPSSSSFSSFSTCAVAALRPAMKATLSVSKVTASSSLSVVLRGWRVGYCIEETLA